MSSDTPAVFHELMKILQKRGFSVQPPKQNGDPEVALKQIVAIFQQFGYTVTPPQNSELVLQLDTICLNDLDVPTRTRNAVHHLSFFSSRYTCNTLLELHRAIQKEQEKHPGLRGLDYLIRADGIGEKSVEYLKEAVKAHRISVDVFK